MIRHGSLALSAAVMAHPDRETEVKRFVDRHPELDLRVALDPEPERRHSLNTALAAWSMVEPGATHHLVLQDDVVLCDDFTARLLAAVRAWPDAAVSPFAEWGSRSGDLVRLALLRGQGYAAVADPYIPTQALVLPAEKAAQFAEGRYWRAETDGGSELEPDDVALYRYLRRTATPAVVVAPNLAQHEDRPSLTGNAFQGPRLSVCFLHDAPAEPIAALAPSVAGSELDYLPHVSWMRLLAEWFYCGPDQEACWTGWPLAERLPNGLDPAWLREQYAAQLDRSDPRKELRGTLSDTVLFEVWLTCFALGLVSGVQPADVEARAHDRLWSAALATVFPGAFRRYLPSPLLDRLGPSATRLFGLAVLAGSEAAADLGREAVLAVAVAGRAARGPEAAA